MKRILAQVSLSQKVSDRDARDSTLKNVLQQVANSSSRLTDQKIPKPVFTASVMLRDVLLIRCVE